MRRELNATLFICRDPWLLQTQKLVPEFYG
jgi:hypothetical protein